MCCWTAGPEDCELLVTSIEKEPGEPRKQAKRSRRKHILARQKDTKILLAQRQILDMPRRQMMKLHLTRSFIVDVAFFSVYLVSTCHSLYLLVTRAVVRCCPSLATTVCQGIKLCNSPNIWRHNTQMNLSTNSLTY